MNQPPFDLVRRQRPEETSPELLLRRQIPENLHDLRRGAAAFQVDDDLAAAINVALAVGAPLLLTGEPGTGKSQVAYYLVHYFGLETNTSTKEWEQPYVFHVKSQSSARDLLYTFDTVAYFHAAQGRDGDEIDKRRFIRRGPLWTAIDALRGDLPRRAPRPAVLLIDEIDKAPRDFPNDLLRELDQYTFEVHETGEKVERPQGVAPPVVVITSNSEKRLPEAFLRRCIFHHVEFSEETLRRAVEVRRRAGDLRRLDDNTVAAAQQRFMEVRGQDLSKKPATAEFLTWLTALEAHGVTREMIQGRRLPLVGALLKDTDDCKLFR